MQLASSEHSSCQLTGNNVFNVVIQGLNGKLLSLALTFVMTFANEAFGHLMWTSGDVESYVRNAIIHTINFSEIVQNDLTSIDGINRAGVGIW